MKKIQKFFAFSLTMLASLPYSRAFAQGSGGHETVFEGGGLERGLEILKGLLPGTGIPSDASLVVAILFWIKILLILSGIFAFVAFVWAGFLYITTFASEENNEKAKKVMVYAAIGIIVILMSYALTNLFINASV